ncbi:formin-like protein 13 [Lactuca sativa]|uniref:formin-like protein 13 n=1 Tax=Lactuca sativa TaxID=4236 RepID=UPI001C68C78B|nr:formin-like protein 13 [Lactuca sativa]
MVLFRNKKLPDGIVDVFERIYVFDSCFRTETWEQEEYKRYMRRIITQLKEINPQFSPMIMNLREGNTINKIHQVLADDYLTIMDYPRDYEGCPVLTIEVIRHFLKSSESWLSFRQHNIVLMHSELGGWPVLSFMLAALLLDRKHFTSESRALEMVLKQAPSQKLPLMTGLDPTASQLRYLQYVSKRNADEQWPPPDKALKLACVIIRMIPDFDGKGGCCPVFRIYGRDPLLQIDKISKLLFSTPRRSKNVRSYNQAENELVKIDINCNIQGDVVLECINLTDDLLKETVMYRTIFNTAFIKSNTLIMSREEVDISWDKKHQFPRDFKAELLFSEMDPEASKVPVDFSSFEDAGIPADAFDKVQDLFSICPPQPPPGCGGGGPPPPPPPTPKPPPAPHKSGSPPLCPVNGNKEGSAGPPPPPLASKGGGVTAPSPPPPINKPHALSRTTAVKIQPGKKLKPLHWSEINRVGQGSLLAEAEKSGEAAKEPGIDMSEPETLFLASNPNSDKALKAKSKAANEPEKVQLIEHRRAFYCELMLSKVKTPLPELMKHVLKLDELAMDVDQVDKLIKFCPTKEEMELLKGYQGEYEMLGKCELFFIELMRIPRAEAKLTAFSYKLHFSTLVTQLRDKISIVYLSVEQLISSIKLRRVMHTILSLGNALNQGTTRGAAVGFRLDSLLKLNETYARNNKMTLMHYLCKVLADKLPELLDFSKELGSLEPASKIQLKILAEEMALIRYGLEKVVQEKKLCKRDGHVSKKFRKSLKKFLASAEQEVKSLASLFSGVSKRVDGFIIYFGEDPMKCPYEKVVETLFKFVRMFNQARDENCKQIEAEKKVAQKAAEQERLKAEGKKKSKVQNHSKMESELIRNKTPIESAEYLFCFSPFSVIKNWWKNKSGLLVATSSACVPAFFDEKNGNDLVLIEEEEGFQLIVLEDHQTEG